MYIKALAVLSLAVVGVLADTTSTDKPTATTAASPSHVSGIPIAITPSGLPECTSTAARHACPGIAFHMPKQLSRHMLHEQTGNVVCSMSDINNSTASGAQSSAVISMSNTMSMAAPSGNSSAAAVSPSAQASKSGGSSITFHQAGAAAVLATGASILAVAMMTSI